MNFEVLILGNISLKANWWLPEEKIYIHWTRKFFKYRLRHPQIIWSELLPIYIKELDSTSSYKDWKTETTEGHFTYLFQHKTYQGCP